MRHSTRFTAFLACALLVALTSISSAAAASGDWAAQPYQLGQGLYFPQQGLRLGGYANLHYYDLHNHAAATSVHDVSLFVTKDFGPRWKAFSEVELADGLTISDGGGSTRHAELDVERLYVDYHARPGMTVRVGKFLTPVGQWNLVHADPLVWTVSRPLTTSAAFARHATGAMVYGTIPLARNDLDYWVFADDSEAVHSAPDRDLAFSAYGSGISQRNNFRNAVGARVLYHLYDDQLNVGASFLSYQLNEPAHIYRLSGIDFSWTNPHFTLSGEGIYRSGGGTQLPQEYGGFLQAVVPLASHLYMVGRFERYHTTLLDRLTTLRTLGLNYRPLPGIVLKLERRQGSRNDLLEPTGWLASFAVLF